MVITIPVKADDILILASDGLSDNLWDEDVLDEVVRFKRSFLDSTGSSSIGCDNGSVPDHQTQGNDSGYSSSSSTEEETNQQEGTIKRKTLAGMLSEALCSRARRVSERKTSPGAAYASSLPTTLTSLVGEDIVDVDVDEVPFAWRAREAGKRFSGGKNDDISVVVAVISPRVK
jgi:hypothetical protein